MDIKKQLNTMNTIFAIACGLWAVWTVYLIIRNIQHPEIVVKDVDYIKGVANIEIGGKPHTLYKNSTFSAGADWGVKFNGPDDNQIDRIELINNDMVHSTLHKAAA